MTLMVCIDFTASNGFVDNFLLFFFPFSLSLLFELLSLSQTLELCFSFHFCFIFFFFIYLFCLEILMVLQACIDGRKALSMYVICISLYFLFSSNRTDAFNSFFFSIVFFLYYYFLTSISLPPFSLFSPPPL